MNPKLIMKDIGIRKITPRGLEDMIVDVKELSGEGLLSEEKKVQLYNVISSIGESTKINCSCEGGTDPAKAGETLENDISPGTKDIPNILNGPFKGLTILNSVKRGVFGSGYKNRYRYACVKILDDYYMIPQSRLYSIKRVSARSIVEIKGWYYFYDEEIGDKIAFLTLSGEDLSRYEDERKFLNCLLVYITEKNKKMIALPFTRFCNFTYEDEKQLQSAVK